LGGPLHAEKNPDFDEYMVVERSNGNLVIFNRHSESFLQCESFDQGKSWTRQKPNDIPHTNARFVFMKLNSGNWLLVKHGSLDSIPDVAETKFKQNKGRSHLTAFLSKDEGKTWIGGLLLDERPCSYPYGWQDGNGTIYISYERNRWNKPEILMARFSEADVRAAKPVSKNMRLKILINKATCKVGKGPEN
jgi:predicted neuraminidase